jgi:hypothetical protein
MVYSPRWYASTSGWQSRNSSSGPRRRAQADELAVEPQQRPAVALLVGDIACSRVKARQPWTTGGEPCAIGAVPLHGVAKGVAASAVQRRLATGAVALADLVSLVDEHRPRQREQQHRGDPFAVGPTREASRG